MSAFRVTINVQGSPEVSSEVSSEVMAAFFINNPTKTSYTATILHAAIQGASLNEDLDKMQGFIKKLFEEYKESMELIINYSQAPDVDQEHRATPLGRLVKMQKDVEHDPKKVGYYEEVKKYLQEKGALEFCAKKPITSSSGTTAQEQRPQDLSGTARVDTGKGKGGKKKVSFETTTSHTSPPIPIKTTQSNTKVDTGKQKHSTQVDPGVPTPILTKQKETLHRELGQGRQSLTPGSFSLGPNKPNKPDKPVLGNLEGRPMGNPERQPNDQGLGTEWAVGTEETDGQNDDKPQGQGGEGCHANEPSAEDGRFMSFIKNNRILSAAGGLTVLAGTAYLLFKKSAKKMFGNIKAMLRGKKAKGANQTVTPATQKATPATQKATPATQKATPATQKATPATQKAEAQNTKIASAMSKQA